MKILFLFLAMTSFIATHVFAQTGYGYNNNRIAVSADGNNQADPNTWGGIVRPTAPAADVGRTFTYNANFQRGDEDDWSATPAALAMLANAGLEGKLVHYSYNNFIGSPAHTSATNIMKNGVDGALQRFSKFNRSVFFDVSANNNRAINHLAEQIKISTASNPLYFVSMGPTEFLYRALQKVRADGKVAAINHVFIISHSNYNDNNIRRGNHHRVEDVLKDFPVQEGRNFRRIKDQNQSKNLTKGWSTNNINGSNNYSQWTWMRDHPDANVNYLWDRMNVNNKSKADISDAGMIWFLLYGDADGNPSKLRARFQSGVIFGNGNGSGTKAFPSGFFHIVNKGSSDYIRPKINSFGSEIVSAPSAWKGAFTQWEAISANDGDFVFLRNRKTKGYLNSLNNNVNGKLSVVENTTERTKWKVVKKGNEFFLENKASQRRIRPASNDDIAASTGANFFTIQKPAIPSFEANFVRWNFIPVGSAKVINTDVDNGIYTIYPNPLSVNEVLNISSTDANNYKLTVTNINGAILYEANDLVGEAQIDRTVFATTGIYFVTITVKDISETYKICVK